MKLKILIVEDIFIEANNLRLILDRAGYAVIPIASTFAEAMDMLDRHKPDLVLLDIYLRGSLTGIDLARILATRKIPFIYLTANSNRKVFQAAKATRPYGFLVKPFRQRDVLAALEVAVELHEVLIKGAMDQSGTNKRYDDSAEGYPFNIVTACKSMQNIFEHIRLVGPSETSVLILGESGTGKELVAKAIHEASNRNSGPFVVVNCGALPATIIESELFGHEKGAFTGALEKRAGKFEAANGGTIFLDEVGELPAESQVKFLRVLQQKEIQPVGGTARTVDVRIIAATNRHLDEEVAAGRFRLDLYYRLNVFPILIPPLRERKDDIMLLANYFLKKFADLARKIITGFSADVIMAMERYDWPGNVREMENLMQRTVLLTKGPVVTEFYHKPAHLNVPTAETRVKSIVENERDHIIATLKACNGKVYGPGGAAELLGINVSTLNSRIKKLGIEKIRSGKKGK
ncbi:sigma-54-dependent transcriptional regulator [Puia dinghuensis]|uniref:Sigma-54-dependent Fis family transcriptional regulator n=1 Tax=Puia dinghuensis TaxID=1792502 RepID=A0A8J2UDW4_9BACT|nr:sigma-54 dependent transcriptional regulator [Puia dinghuensis]GGB04200.1 sigma-54-dependent Fis family transcriptional regulator [Puia dinghuensis]